MSSNWREPFRSLVANSVSGSVEGDAVDLGQMLPSQAMHVFVTSSGSPTYRVVLEGEWRSGGGWAVLAELDETTAPLSTAVVIRSYSAPCRSLRASLYVASGTVDSVDVSVSAGSDQ